MTLSLALLGVSGAARAESSGVSTEQQRGGSTTGGDEPERVRITLGAVASPEDAFGVTVAVDTRVWRSLYVGPVGLAAVGEEVWLLGGIRAGLQVPLHAKFDLFPWVSAAAFYGNTWGSYEYGRRRTLNPVSPAVGLRFGYRGSLIAVGLETAVVLNDVEYSEGYWGATEGPYVSSTSVEPLAFVSAVIGFSL